MALQCTQSHDGMNGYVELCVDHRIIEYFCHAHQKIRRMAPPNQLIRAWNPDFSMDPRPIQVNLEDVGYMAATVTLALALILFAQP